MSTYPTHKQVQDIVTTILNDIVVDDQITESQIHEAGRGVAAQIARWDRDVNPTSGSKSHHILNTLAGSDTPIHVDQLLEDDLTLQSIAPALDNLMTAHYVQVTPKGYKITADGLRALGAAPVKTYTLTEQTINRQILNAIREAGKPLEYWEIRPGVEMGPAEATGELNAALDNLVDSGYLIRGIHPGNKTTYWLGEKAQGAGHLL